jgi:hypothetical protein
MDRANVELSLFPSGLRRDFQTADGVRAARIEHAVEDGRFGLLTREASSPKAQTDDGLVSAHRGINQGALAVVDLLLPAQPSSSGYRKNVQVSLRWVVFGLGTEYRRHMGRDNPSNIFSVTSHRIVWRDPNLSAVRCDAGDCRLYLIQQHPRPGVTFSKCDAPLRHAFPETIHQLPRLSGPCCRSTSGSAHQVGHSPWRLTPWSLPFGSRSCGRAHSDTPNRLKMEAIRPSV